MMKFYTFYDLILKINSFYELVMNHEHIWNEKKILLIQKLYDVLNIIKVHYWYDNLNHILKERHRVIKSNFNTGYCSIKKNKILYCFPNSLFLSIESSVDWFTEASR